MTEAILSEIRFLGDFLADIARFAVKWCPKLIAGAILLYFVFISLCCLWPVLLLAAAVGLGWWLRRPLAKLAEIVAWLVFAVLAVVLVSVFVGMLAGCSLSILIVIILLMQITSPPQVVVVVVDSHGNKI